MSKYDLIKVKKHNSPMGKFQQYVYQRYKDNQNKIDIICDQSPSEINILSETQKRTQVI